MAPPGVPTRGTWDCEARVAFAVVNQAPISVRSGPGRNAAPVAILEFCFRFLELNA